MSATPCPALGCPQLRGWLVGGLNPSLSPSCRIHFAEAQRAPVLVLDVDKDFEHDVAVQGVLMAQVGQGWHSPVASRCHQSHTGSKPPSRFHFPSGKMLSTLWVRGGLNLSCARAILCQSCTVLVPPQCIPTPS